MIGVVTTVLATFNVGVESRQTDRQHNLKGYFDKRGVVGVIWYSWEETQRVFYDDGVAFAFFLAKVSILVTLSVLLF